MSAGKANAWGWVVSVLSCLMFFLSAYFKFVDGPDVAKGFEHLGLPDSMRLPLGVLELAVVTVYLIGPSSVLGAILMTGYIGGAICTHWRVGDSFLVHIVLGLLIWFGLYLREPRLKALLPLRRP